MDYVQTTKKEQEEMLVEIGETNVSKLFEEIPAKIKKPLDIQPMSEPELRKYMEMLAEKNKKYKFGFLGAGTYNHFIPSVVGHIISRSEFYTAYTPYQAEISQGYLQAIYEYQTMICNLAGMDITNASMYDGASAVAEAASMAVAYKRRKNIVVSKSLNPEYRKVIKSYASCSDIEIMEIGVEDGLTSEKEIMSKVDTDTAAVIVSSPNFFGLIEDLEKFSKIAHEKGAVMIASISDATSLGLLKSPGSQGCDIFAGDGQAFGIPMSFGGPHLGIISCKKGLMRQLPGRIVGATTDKDGNKGYVLTLQAREQHIRRERALSNVCSNQALCALAATVYLAYCGKKLRDVSMHNAVKSKYMFDKIIALDGFSKAFDGHFYNEFVVKCDNPMLVNRILEDKGILGGFDLSQEYPELKGMLMFCVTENNTYEEIDDLVRQLEVM